MRGWRRA
jgi:hypothetical protein